MCLDLKKGNSKIKTAKEDITCWKWLKLDNDGKLFSPYQKTRYYLNDRMKDSKRVRKTPPLHCLMGDAVECCLHDGCFHTFRHFHDASLVSVLSAHNEAYQEVIVKCTIPKGSKYYEGYFTPGFVQPMESYASKELVITDRIHSTALGLDALKHVNEDETYIKK